MREISPVTDAAPDARAEDALAIDAARPACVEGDLQAEDPTTGHCYAHIAAPANWPTAQAQCAALGTGFTLAAITSEAEGLFVESFAPATDLWIGGNDIATEASFVWVTGEPFDYENWRPGEPNNGMGAFEEDCVGLEVGGAWDDRPCGGALPVLCERD